MGAPLRMRLPVFFRFLFHSKLDRSWSFFEFFPAPPLTEKTQLYWQSMGVYGRQRWRSMASGNHSCLAYSVSLKVFSKIRIYLGRSDCLRSFTRLNIFLLCWFQVTNKIDFEERFTADDIWENGVIFSQCARTSYETTVKPNSTHKKPRQSKYLTKPRAPLEPENW